jgi:hypothetical protein
MAARHHERTQARPLEWVDACEIGDPDYLPGHYGHHMHIEGNGIVCSCGQIMGNFTIAIDPRYWSDDPAEKAQARREDEDWYAWVTCSVCGRKGVQYEGDFGKPFEIPARESA